MAEITLHRSECYRSFLPRNCMRCSTETDDIVRKEFKWSPPSGYLPLNILLRIATTKRMSVEIPICPKHRGQWGRATLAVILLILLCVAAAVVFVVSSNGQDPGIVIFLGSLGTWIVSLSLILVFATNQIRPSHIDDESITFVGVDSHFAKFVKEKQAKEMADRR